jgi:hypothetical protein
LRFRVFSDKTSAISLIRFHTLLTFQPE